MKFKFYLKSDLKINYINSYYICNLYIYLFYYKKIFCLKNFYSNILLEQRELFDMFINYIYFLNSLNLHINLFRSYIKFNRSYFLYRFYELFSAKNICDLNFFYKKHSLNILSIYYLLT